MIVRRPRVELVGDRARLMVRVESEAGAFDPCTVTIAVPRPQAAWLDTSGTPWVPTCLLLAATLREPLRIEAPVSPRLLAAASRAAALFACWWNLDPVAIEAEALTGDAPEAGGETVCCFTRGVDSWFSVLDGTMRGGSPRPTRLLYVPDLDRHYSPPRRREALRRTAEAAERLGLPLLVVEHDGRDLLDRFVTWDDAHGGALAGVGLALGHGVATFVIPASYDLAHLAPHGSHPDLDPLWSTERTTVVHHGAEVGRTAKVRALADVPLALRRLKVCWSADLDDNCGRCRKCLRTMLQLALAGALERTDVFAAPLSLDAFVALPPPHRDRRRMLAAELYDAMPDDAAWAEWKEALRARLSWWHPAAPARPAVPDGMDVVVEAPPGTALELAAPMARSVLPGAIVPRDDGAADRPDVGRLEVTWVRPARGRRALPWRPTVHAREALLAACRDAEPRPVAWCLLEPATPGSAALASDLTAAWGPGIVWTAPTVGSAHQAAAAIQRRSSVRAWRGDATGLDPFRVLEALRHGCLPLQCVDDDEYDVLVPELPRGLEAFVVSSSDLAPLPPGTRAARLARGLSVVLAGSLERDVHHALAALAPVGP